LSVKGRLALFVEIFIYSIYFQRYIEHMKTFSPIHLCLITTGGTIEKIYDEADGVLENRGPVIKEKISSKLRLPYTEFEVRPLMSKDSLHMVEEDRKQIVAEIQKCLALGHAVVVLHGTDTMTLTAQLALKMIHTPTAPVVFTGAMRPLGFEDSDAIQNVTEAILAARLLPPGVYISFHSCVYPAQNVQKIKSKNTFGPLT
jgi:L-asparaginase